MADISGPLQTGHATRTRFITPVTPASPSAAVVTLYAKARAFTMQPLQRVKVSQHCGRIASLHSAHTWPYMDLPVTGWVRVLLSRHPTVLSSTNSHEIEMCGHKILFVAAVTGEYKYHGTMRCKSSTWYGARHRASFTAKVDKRNCHYSTYHECMTCARQGGSVLY
jgi:hypothetical protein